MSHLLSFVLQEADNNLILGQRLSAWCGHGPILEQDIALTNIALDLIGQARSLYAYAEQLEGAGRSEDDFAFKRDVMDFKNVLLVEQPNGHWGTTIMRQFFYDAYHFYFLDALQFSKDEQLAAIAAKSIKEVSYHLRFSSEWVIRLGDGTPESHAKMQEAADELWMYTGELFRPSAADEAMFEAGIGADIPGLHTLWSQKVKDVFREATLTVPTGTWMQKGGKSGRHSEHLGYILAEMQYLPRAYPEAKW